MRTNTNCYVSCVSFARGCYCSVTAPASPHGLERGEVPRLAGDRRAAADRYKHCGLSIAGSKCEAQANSLGRKKFQANRRRPESGGLRSWSVCATKRVLGLANHQEVRDNSISKESS